MILLQDSWDPCGAREPFDVLALEPTRGSRARSGFLMSETFLDICYDNVILRIILNLVIMRYLKSNLKNKLLIYNKNQSHLLWVDH